MKLLKIPQSRAYDENIQIASSRLPLLFKKPKSEVQDLYRENIQTRMEDLPLSDWFSLYIRCIFYQIYTASDSTRNEFLTDVANLRLNKFSREYHGIPARVELMKTHQFNVFQSTQAGKQEFVNYSKKIKGCLKTHSQSHGERLALFLLIEKIVLVIDKMEKIPQEIPARLKEMMILSPHYFLADLVPILLKLQELYPDEQENEAMPIIEQAIDATLKLLGCDGDNQLLVKLVVDNLLVQGYLVLTDAVETEPDLTDEVIEALTKASV